MHLDGERQVVHYDKITARIEKLTFGLNLDFVDPVSLLEIVLDYVC